MKINQSKHIGPINPYKQFNDHKLSIGANKKELQKDAVVISNQAKELLGSKSAKRIEELKQSVSSGKYYVNTKDLADKLFPFFK